MVPRSRRREAPGIRPLPKASRNTDTVDTEQSVRTQTNRRAIATSDRRQGVPSKSNERCFRDDGRLVVRIRSILFAVVFFIVIVVGVPLLLVYLNDVRHAWQEQQIASARLGEG